MPADEAKSVSRQIAHAKTNAAGKGWTVPPSGSATTCAARLVDKRAA